MYYWWPKVFGRRLGEGLGKAHFWIMLVGFNLTFGPMHVLGLQGMIRREFTYPESLGLTFWNQVSSVGAFMIALSILLFIVNVAIAGRRPRTNEADPWDGRTIEWTTSSPPPEYNFAEVPQIHALDDFWHRKYAEDTSGRLVPVQAGAADDGGDHTEEAGHGIHLPNPSFWPIVAALGLPILGYGAIFHWWLLPVGAVVVLVAFYGWALEPSAE
jgi:cytochrome c oxidase subunit 1